MAVQDRPAVAERIREVANFGAYREVALAARYPVAAMLISQSLQMLVVTALLSRSLGAAAFGRYAVVITIAGLFQLLAAFPVESGLPKFLAESRQTRPERVHGYYGAGLLIRSAVGVTAVGLALVAAGAVSRAYHMPNLQWSVLVASLGLCLLKPLSDFFLACIQGMEQPARWSTGSLLVSLIVFPLTIAGVHAFHRWGLAGLFAAIAVAWALAAVGCAVLARRAMGFLRPTALHWPQVRELVPFLLPMWIVPLVGFGTKTVLKLFLAKTCGAVPVGQFEIALTLLVHMGTIYRACMIVFTPAWARLYAARQAAELLRSIAQVRGALVGVAILYGAALALAGQWVVPAIFGRGELGAVPAARVMGVIMPVMTAGWVASVTNVVSNRTRNIGMANLVWFAIAIPLGLALTPYLGALGTALAWFGAYAVFAWYYISSARPFFREVQGWLDREKEDAGSLGPVSAHAEDGIRKA